MSALTTTAAPSDRAAAPARGLLRGTSWVVWRRNRTVLLLLIGVTVLFAGYCVYLHGMLADFLASPQAAAKPGQLLLHHEERMGTAFFLLAFLPAILGVFLGAPLLAAEQEHNTLRLITTQSVARLRVVMTMLALPLLVVAVTTALMSVAFTWVWRSVDTRYSHGNWWTSDVIATTGPVPVALALFSTAFGILAGAVLRRSVAAMGVTFLVLVLGAQTLKDRAPEYFVTFHQLTYPLGGDAPELKSGEIQVDNWVGSADGTLHGWGKCVLMTEAESDACVKKHGIVNDVIDYVKLDQLPGIQWSMTAVLLAMTAAMLVATVFWMRRKSL
ncbi:ABC transporter permease [Streptomyces uncialis]|uniref:ABC transporter permease n=1 Tax=Streptomyces uncialis TaxID=1048205 RepID=UPI0022566418|nr:ABC transporter permease [Streptomyces uncialis]MCX4664539.1 ABC transporter permease [Streptomyces uncialis]